MIKNFSKNIIVFIATFIVCVGALLAVCQIPQSSIYENSKASSEYFTDSASFPVLIKGHANTRIDNYADCILFNVIYNMDEQQAMKPIIAAPYYRIEGNDAREDFASAVIDGKEPNNEYSRYWHGSQVLIRPLLLLASVEQNRLILFGLLIALLRYFEDSTEVTARQTTSDRIRKIHDHVQRIKENEEVGIRFMNAWEEKILDRQEAYEEGKASGLKEGEVNQRRKIAANFKKAGIDIEVIAENTGLFLEEVEKL